MANQIDTVFLIEDRTKDTPEPMTYWARVYVSRDKARAGVEHWAAKRPELGRLTWTEGSFGVMIARAEGADDSKTFTIVPLDVLHDSEPEHP